MINNFNCNFSTSSATPLIQWMHESLPPQKYVYYDKFTLSFNLTEEIEPTIYEQKGYFLGEILDAEIADSKGFDNQKRVIQTLANYDEKFNPYLLSSKPREMVTLVETIEKVTSISKNYILTVDTHGHKELFSVLFDKACDLASSLVRSDVTKEFSAKMELTDSDTHSSETDKEPNIVLEEEVLHHGKKIVTEKTLSHKLEEGEIRSTLEKKITYSDFTDLRKTSEIEYVLFQIDD
jgi:hypothetical protein